MQTHYQQQGKAVKEIMMVDDPTQKDKQVALGAMTNKMSN